MPGSTLVSVLTMVYLNSILTVIAKEGAEWIHFTDREVSSGRAKVCLRPVRPQGSCCQPATCRLSHKAASAATDKVCDWFTLEKLQKGALPTLRCCC